MQKLHERTETPVNPGAGNRFGENGRVEHVGLHDLYMDEDTVAATVNGFKINGKVVAPALVDEEVTAILHRGEIVTGLCKGIPSRTNLLSIMPDAVCIETDYKDPSNYSRRSLPINTIRYIASSQQMLALMDYAAPRFPEGADEYQRVHS